MSERTPMLPINQDDDLEQQPQARPKSSEQRTLIYVALFLGVCLLIPLVISLATDNQDFVLLISLDGFRPDYLQRGLTPNLKDLIGSGIAVPFMQPVFPSVTFTNHYTIVTGLYPQSHGIVGNSFYDSALNETFAYYNPVNNGQEKWWGGEPIWITCVKQNLKAATLFWPGSEAPIKGTRPTYYMPYNGSFSMQEKVDQVLSWFDMSPSQRPDFMSLYIPQVDSQGHKYGPDSLQVNQTLTEVDLYLGKLFAGLKSRKMMDRTNIIIVSDHGMTLVDPFNKVLFLSDYIDMRGLRVVENGPLLSIYPPNGLIAPYVQNLTAASKNGLFEVWIQVPEGLHYTHPTRTAPITILPIPGYMFARYRNGYDPNKPPFPLGVHGYLPTMTDMHATFIAHGPYFEGREVPPYVANIDVYQLIADVLGIKAAPNNGTRIWK
ncbi:alkaline-phosphatase-like protein [Gorgonomyces haynaldii]|nr:alkaline-phosphatase-like protein [Gorgonomyces haynaldii]